MQQKVKSVERIRHEVVTPAPYTPKTTSGDIATKFSETPRTLHGNAAAFKCARYGNCIEHYSAPSKYAPLLWTLAFILLAGVAIMLVAADKA
jgi:hypothetical protein